MHHSRLSILAGAFVLSLTAGAACIKADIHDNTVDFFKDAKLDFTVDGDTSMVKEGQAIPITLNAMNVFLIEPNQTPPAAHINDAGHFQIYLDNTDNPPILITAKTMVSVMIAQGTSPGPHKLICRLHKHDGTPTSIKVEVDITVTVMVGNVPDAGSPDSGA